MKSVARVILLVAVALLIVGLVGEAYFLSTGDIAVGPALVPVVFGVVVLLVAIGWSVMVLRHPAERLNPRVIEVGSVIRPKALMALLLGLVATGCFRTQATGRLGGRRRQWILDGLRRPRRWAVPEVLSAPGRSDSGRELGVSRVRGLASKHLDHASNLRRDCCDSIHRVRRRHDCDGQLGCEHDLGRGSQDPPWHPIRRHHFRGYLVSGECREDGRAGVLTTALRHRLCGAPDEWLWLSRGPVRTGTFLRQECRRPRRRPARRNCLRHPRRRAGWARRLGRNSWRGPGTRKRSNAVCRRS